MNHLQSVENVSNRVAVTESNFEAIDESRAFALNPTKVEGEETTDMGPPADGEHYLGELWTDVNCAEYRCTVAGTPGTWKQIRPAVVDVDPVGAPNDYVIARSAEWLKLYYWDGGVWVAV
jgi:hypothetical protein